MQYIKLTCDVSNAGHPLEKAVAAAKMLGLSTADRKFPRLREKVIFGEPVQFLEGAVVPMSEASAAKYVANGVAELVDAP